MLKHCHVWLKMVTHSSLKYATYELNDRLDIRDGRRPVPKNELRQFLTRSVLPILEGTALDRRDNTAEMRHWLGQLLRDASFSAHVLKATPSGPFLRALTECIKEDATRMNFIQKMTSAQASKTVEHLCSVGVRDPAVYAALLTRIQFTNLREVARVMFAFTEAGLSTYNVNLLVPLYCGETFSLTVTYRPNAPRKDENAYCNLLDAVRVLRALSKSVRTSVEATRADDSVTSIPHSSINQLRNALVLFIMQNAEEPFLRGAHWSNFARALIHFPAEVGTLIGLAEQGGDALWKQRLLVRTVEPLLVAHDNTAPWLGREGADLSHEPVTCVELARYGLLRVFDVAEGRVPVSPRRSDPSSSAPRRDARGRAGAGDGSDDTSRVFDVSSRDLIKLVRVVQEVYPPTSPLRGQRVGLVLDALMDQLSTFHFRSLLQLLQAMRTMLDDDLSQQTVRAITSEAARRLRDPQTAADIPFPAFVEFCSLLSIFRIHNCPEATTYICEARDTFPKSLDGHSALALLKALTVTRDGNLSARREAGLDVAERLTFHYQRAGPLLSTEPILCDRMWAALVLLDAVPTPVMLDRCCGSAGSAPLTVSAPFRAAGGVVLFDISRSLFHFGKEAAATAPAQVPKLWETGVARALLPLLADFNRLQLQDVHASRAGARALTSGYVPISWRSSMEAVSLYLDKVSPAEGAQMLANVMEVLKSIGRSAALWALEQIEHLEAQASAGTRAGASRDGLSAKQKAFQQLPFSSNAPLHLLSYLLMFEHCVLRAGWKCRSLNEVAALTEGLRVDYLAYLRAPLNAEVSTRSIMDVVALIFNASVEEETGASIVAAASLIQRRHALEITTNLPFAISLVLEAGPVNEYFTERTVPLMMAALEDGPEE